MKLTRPGNRFMKEQGTKLSSERASKQIIVAYLESEFAHFVGVHVEFV